MEDKKIISGLNHIAREDVASILTMEWIVLNVKRIRPPAFDTTDVLCGFRDTYGLTVENILKISRAVRNRLSEMVAYGELIVNEETGLFWLSDVRRLPNSTAERYCRLMALGWFQVEKLQGNKFFLDETRFEFWLGRHRGVTVNGMRLIRKRVGLVTRWRVVRYKRFRVKEPTKT